MKYTVTAFNTGGKTTTELTIGITDIPPESLSYEDVTLTVGEFGKSAPDLAPLGIPAEFVVDPAVPEGPELGLSLTLASNPNPRVLLQPIQPDGKTGRIQRVG